MPFDPTANLHTLASHGFPLGIECGACGTRTLIPLDRIGARSGNMKMVKTLKLVCRCGSRIWRPPIFHRQF